MRRGQDPALQCEINIRPTRQRAMPQCFAGRMHAAPTMRGKHHANRQWAVPRGFGIHAAPTHRPNAVAAQKRDHKANGQPAGFPRACRNVYAVQGHTPPAVCTVCRFFPRCQRYCLHELAFLWNFACMRTVDKPGRGDYNNRDFGYERWRLCSRNRHRLFYSPCLSAVHAQTCAKMRRPGRGRPPGSAICIP